MPLPLLALLALGAAAGGGIGAATGGKHAGRNALIGALLGGATGGIGGAALGAGGAGAAGAGTLGTGAGGMGTAAGGSGLSAGLFGGMGSGTYGAGLGGTGALGTGVGSSSVGAGLGASGFGSSLAAPTTMSGINPLYGAGSAWNTSQPASPVTKGFWDKWGTPIGLGATAASPGASALLGKQTPQPQFVSGTKVGGKPLMPTDLNIYPQLQRRPSFLSQLLMNAR